MIRQLIIILMMVLAGTGHVHSQVPDDLVDRINEKMDSYQADSTYTCLVTSTSIKMDKHWQPKETTIIEKQMVVDAGRAEFEILRAVEKKKNKEKDITEAVREEWRESQSKENEDEEEKREVTLTTEDMIPFGEERRSLYEFSQLPDTTIDNTLIHRIQSRAIHKDKDVYEGIYWIQADTYAIIRTVLHPSKNPKFVKELQLDFRFQELEGSRWNLSRMTSRVFIDLLVKKMRFQSEEVFRDYQFNP